MIWRIWLKLFLIALLAVVPLMTAHYLMQKESIGLVLQVAEKSSPSDFMDDHLANLKKLSQLDPKNSETYRTEFERAAEARNVGKDMRLIRDKLVDDLLFQTLRNTLFVLLTALGITYLIARSIVGLLRRLVRENQTHSLRLERMSALESWQKIARMMVHEMRAPITPIKLVATDIESKFQTLDSTAFQKYLARGTDLLRTQVTSIERLTDSLTKFARLPEVQKKPGSIPGFLDQFIETYREYGSKNIERTGTAETRIPFDATLMNLLLFNLLKNAVEANPDKKIDVRIHCRQDVDKTWIDFRNSGHTIPESVARDMFKLHVSTKGDSGSNFGVGLTIAKKIALDHNGDLFLAKNSNDDGVVFELELPNL